MIWASLGSLRMTAPCRWDAYLSQASNRTQRKKVPSASSQAAGGSEYGLPPRILRLASRQGCEKYWQALRTAESREEDPYPQQNGTKVARHIRSLPPVIGTARYVTVTFHLQCTIVVTFNTPCNSLSIHSILLVYGQLLERQQTHCCAHPNPRVF